MRVSYFDVFYEGSTTVTFTKTTAKQKKEKMEVEMVSTTIELNEAERG